MLRRIFLRPEKPEGRLVLQERDFQILLLVWMYRFLDSCTLRLLLGYKVRGEWACGSRLKVLWEHKYLDRPRQQIALMVTGDESFLVYGLGQKGADVLADRLGIPIDQSRWSQRNQEAGNIFLAHCLGLARFRACLTLTIPDEAPHEGSSDYTKPYRLPWKTGDELRARVEIELVRGTREKVTLIPDAFFGLQRPHESPNRNFYFLEYERGTGTLRRFLRSKGMAYRAYWKTGLHEKQLGIKGFRVLIVSPTERKSETLRDTLFSWQVQAGIPNTEQWLFTSEERFSIECPESILRPIWRVADPGGEHLISLI